MADASGQFVITYNGDLYNCVGVPHRQTRHGVMADFGPAEGSERTTAWVS
jgi:hypothetical protein